MDTAPFDRTMERQEVIQMLGKDWDEMVALIHSTLHSDVELLNTTNRSIVSHNGKQLRPMMCLLMAKACSGSATPDSIKFAAASEILHNATLIHDDVADESDERRGRPTVVSMLGPTSAVLLGDYWLSKAVEVILSADRSLRIAKLFSKTLTDLSEGEMLQLEKAASADTVEDDYFRIIYCKTASLFEAAVVSGAESVDACEEYIHAAGDYARLCGIAFQIKDDILDYAGDSALGKPTGIDIKEHKITLPLLGAMAGSGRSGEIREMIRGIDRNPGHCDDIHRFVLENGGVDYAARILERYVEQAVEALDVLPDTPYREALKDIARYNTFRKI